MSKRIELASYKHVPPAGPPSMITAEERVALACFAERAWKIGATRDGIIVDAGCFVGSSTSALAFGLRRALSPELEKHQKIWSYDNFVATEGMSRDYFLKDGIGPGGSFQPVFERNLDEYREYIRVFPGDIIKAQIPDRRIAVLFVDILWSYEAANQFGRTFYPRLEAKKSLIFHQDFVYPYYPWVPISMGLLSRQLRFAYQIPYSSVVFDVIQPVGVRDVEDCRNVGRQKGEAIFDDFIGKVEGWGKGALAISKSLWLGGLGDIEGASAVVDEVVQKYSGVPLVAQYLPVICPLLEGAIDQGGPYTPEAAIEYARRQPV